MPVTITERVRNANQNQRYLYFAYFLALAVILNISESIIPKPPMMPWLRLGLTNVITLYILDTLGVKYATALVALRVIVASVMTGSLLSAGFFLSAAGALASLAGMAALSYARPAVSIWGISVAGAVLSNCAQIAAAFLILHLTAGIFYLTPVLILLGIATGLVTAFFAGQLLKI